ncbi:MAG: hypothetical protein SGPRY_005559 [Prymnesium sp.]
MDKDAERAELIREPGVAPLKELTEFVERLIRVNTELEYTNYNFEGDFLTNHMLAALRRHDPVFVHGIQGTYIGRESQLYNFITVWGFVKDELEALGIGNKRTYASADVLCTAEPKSPVSAMKSQHSKMLLDCGKSVLKASVRGIWPLCEDCNTKHRQGKTA